MSRKLLNYYCGGCGHENGKFRTEITDVWSDAPPPECPSGHGPMSVRIGGAATVRSFAHAPSLARVLDQVGPRRKPARD